MIKKAIMFAIIIFGTSLAYSGQQTSPLLPESTLRAVAEELSGVIAKRNLEYLSRYHRQRGSREFLAAAEHIAEQLRLYGLSEVKILEFPADGKTFYGTQRARLAWDAEFAELWELKRSGKDWVPSHRLASWDAMPITLAEDSESANLEAELVDVGKGTSESDYAGKKINGKLVLVSSQPRAVETLAIERHGAVGIISYAQNQRTAWWREDENLVRWGHLNSFSENPTFAFMVSLKQARSFQERLVAGETVRLHAIVRAGKHSGFYNVVTATIPGADPVLQTEEIAFSCHLDHQLPGANDNASGSVTILEVARTLSKLIKEGKIARPARTLRFIWPPEIEGTLALLNSQPEFAARIKAVIHMDMVGGGPETKSIFHITRGPASLPSVIYDVAGTFAEFVNRQSDAFASGKSVEFPLISPEGGKEALQAELVDFKQGSDHHVYNEGSFGIPAIYLNDWPDRYIHTNFDTPSNIDPTKLKRAAFIGGATGYFLANLSSHQAPSLWRMIRSQCLRRTATMLGRREGLPPEEADNLTRFHYWYEHEIFRSMESFFEISTHLKTEAEAFFASLEKLIGQAAPPIRGKGDGTIVFLRNPSIKGPVRVYGGYNYFDAHYVKEQNSSIRLTQFQGARGAGRDYAYEVLNFVNGRRTVQEIRDAVSAEYGPIPLELVLEYLKALESIEIITIGS